MMLAKRRNHRGHAGSAEKPPIMAEHDALRYTPSHGLGTAARRVERPSAPRNIRSVFARNIILARAALRLTQEALAQASGISRATIAQIEAGENDCRLSTFADLAAAMRISPVLLHLREADLASLIRHLPRPLTDRVLHQLPANDVAQMYVWLDSGLQRNLIRVATRGAAAASAGGLTSRGAAVGAAIGSVIDPGVGTAGGAALGEILSQSQGVLAEVMEGGAGI